MLTISKHLLNTNKVPSNLGLLKTTSRIFTKGWEPVGPVLFFFFFFFFFKLQIISVVYLRPFKRCDLCFCACVCGCS
jgi:hypothetical protein